MNKIDVSSKMVIIILVIACVIFVIYSAGLSSQLKAEKIKNLQLNDQIAGLNFKTSDLQAQLDKAISQAENQASLTDNFRVTLDKVSAELADLKIAYSDLELKLKEQVSAPIK